MTAHERASEIVAEVRKYATIRSHNDEADLLLAVALIILQVQMDQIKADANIAVALIRGMNQ